MTVATRKTDDARRLKWLREQVQPVLAGLRDRGRGAEALAAIGCAGFVADNTAEERTV